MKEVKRFLEIIILSTLLIFGTLVGYAISTDNTCDIDINLPTDTVTMIAYNGTDYGVDSYFLTVLSNIPSGYDVTNGEYLGWCIQRDTMMPRGSEQNVKMYCSYDPNIPNCFQSDNWDKVNYILNNKQGTWEDIQDAIWYFINGVGTSRSIALTMIDDAYLNGGGFCPDPGDVIAIILNGSANIQDSIIEYDTTQYEGKSHGFWKNHEDDWEIYEPENKIGDIFDLPEELESLNVTLIKGLKFGGGGGIKGGAKNLFRQSIAALLNSAHHLVEYPLTELQVITETNNALASLNRSIMEDLQLILDGYNNLGCDDF